MPATYVDLSFARKLDMAALVNTNPAYWQRLRLRLRLHNCLNGGNGYGPYLRDMNTTITDPFLTVLGSGGGAEALRLQSHDWLGFV